MEAIEKLKIQIEPLLSTIKLQRAVNEELRGKILRLEADNALKDEYIKVLEEEICSLQSSNTKSVDSQPQEVK